MVGRSGGPIAVGYEGPCTRTAASSKVAADAAPAARGGTTLQALQLTAWKHAPELREVAEPDPGPGQVVVRIGGAGACHSDLHLIHDFDEGMLPFWPPFTLGHENAGWVEAVGTGVVGLEPGMPVAVYGPWGCGHCIRCRQGMENYCENLATLGKMGGGLGYDGGMAPLMLVPSARHVVPIGDLDPVEAAPLTDAGLTPYHAVKRSLPLLGARSAAVVIGAGGLGHMAIQVLAALSAAEVIAVDVSTEALHLAQAVGATHAVESGEDAAGQIQELTHGRGADVVLDFVGIDSTLALATASSRSLGHVTLVGIGGGSYPFSFFSTPYEVSMQTTYWGSLPELMEVIALAEQGKLRAHIERYSLDDATQAYEAMHEGSLRGRAVIVP
jgi:propanol-preferring alcohol dehydrogenase